MIKTIKKNVQLRLDELLKYILDYDIVGKRYEERMDYDSYSITHAVHVTGGGEVIIEGTYKPDQTFTVEVEEEITEDTKFETLLEINNAGELYHYKNTTISSMSGASSKYFHAIIDGKLQLIWEAE